MFHVPQRAAKDCGIAVAAMVGEVTYEEALEHYGGVAVADPPDVELLPREVARVLEGITQARWRVARPWAWWRRVGTFRFAGARAAALIAGPRAVRHYVAVQGDLLHDPGFGGPFLRARYPKRGWSVRAVIEPAGPVTLLEHLARRRARILRELSAELGRA